MARRSSEKYDQGVCRWSACFSAFHPSQVSGPVPDARRQNARCVRFDAVGFLPKPDYYASESPGLGEGAGSEQNNQEADRHGRIV
jgi:hypothetical protein